MSRIHTTLEYLLEKIEATDDAQSAVQFADAYHRLQYSANQYSSAANCLVATDEQTASQTEVTKRTRRTKAQMEADAIPAAAAPAAAAPAAAAPAATPSAAAPAAEPEPSAEDLTGADMTPTYTKDDLRKVINAKLVDGPTKAPNFAKISGFLKEAGAKNVSELPDDKIAALYDKVNSL
jgi:pyruvate/2-oxoglutarate dehydrogenase complex dihydrolipoamide acyltransferase (E2) component